MNCNLGIHEGIRDMGKVIYFRFPDHRPAYFVRRRTLKFTRKNQQHMKVHVGSDEIFSSVFLSLRGHLRVSSFTCR